MLVVSKQLAAPIAPWYRRDVARTGPLIGKVGLIALVCFCGAWNTGRQATLNKRKRR